MKRFAFILCLIICNLAWAADTSRVFLPTRSLPNKLEPHQLLYAIDNYIFRQIAEGLFDIGDGFRIDPKLAASTSWSEDNRQLTIHLREANFSDGTPVTANLALDALARCLAISDQTQLLAVQAISGFDDFRKNKTRYPRGLKVIDDKTIQVSLDYSSTLLIDELSQAECYVIKPAADGSLDLLHGAIGSGPYVFDKRVDDDLVLKKNSRYYKNSAGPATAVYRKTEDYGNFDRLKEWVTMAFLETAPPEDADFEKIESSELGTYQLDFNNSKLPFNNVKIRQAIALGLDYFSLGQAMGWAAETMQYGLIPYGMPGFRKRMPDDVVGNRKKAAKILKGLGYGPNHPLTFSILIADSPSARREAPLWQKAFGDLPIRVSVQSKPFSEFAALMSAGDYQGLRVTKYPGSVEPHRLLAFYLSSSKYNLTKSHEPKCDDLTRKSLRSASRDDRFRLYQNSEDCLLERAILLPLASMQPGFIVLKKPWRLRRTNRYQLYPYWISEWYKND